MKKAFSAAVGYESIITIKRKGIVVYNGFGDASQSPFLFLPILFSCVCPSLVSIEEEPVAFFRSNGKRSFDTLDYGIVKSFRHMDFFKKRKSSFLSFVHTLFTILYSPFYLTVSLHNSLLQTQFLQYLKGS